MRAELIPAADPAALPGPPWLFHVLWVVTFVVHVLLLNSVLGGTLLAAVAGGRTRGRREMQQLFVGINSWTVSLAITFGIAPLLFMQVLFGRFFYSATILVAWAWFGMLGLLTLGYYLNYLAKHRLATGRSATATLAVEAVCFAAVAAVQVAVNLLHLQPGRWPSVAAEPWAALADPSFLPRFLHFLLAAVGMSGVLVAYVAVRRAQRTPGCEASGEMARFGVRAALLATMLQIAVGLWLLLALPGDVLRAFMRGGAATMGPLSIGIVLALALLVVLAQAQDPLAHPTTVRRAAELLVGATVVMVVTRHQLRGVYLEAANPLAGVTVAPQWGVFLLFLAALVACLALAGWAVARALRDRPSPGEPAA